MRIYSKLVWDIETGQLLEANYFEYRGEVASCKGASTEEKDAAKQEKEISATLLDNYKTQFAGQVGILKSINDAWQPIEKAGIGQYGLTAQADSALRTQASEGTAAAYKMAKQATGESLAAVGGGNTFLPSATKAGIMANTANLAAGQEADQQLGITRAGYEQGRQNFLTSAGILSGEAQMMNPTAYSGQAEGAAQGSFQDYSTITKENAAASPWKMIGGIAGGALGAFAGPLGAKLGSSLRSKIAGSASGSGADDSSQPWQ